MIFPAELFSGRDRYLERQKAITGIAISFCLTSILLLLLEPQAEYTKFFRFFTFMFILVVCPYPAIMFRKKKKSKKTIHLLVFSGKKARLNRIIFAVLNFNKPLTIYELYIQIRQIKGYRHTKWQSIYRRVKTLSRERWLIKIGVKLTKADFISPLFVLSKRAHVAQILDNTDLDVFLEKAPEYNLKLMMQAIEVKLIFG